MRLGRDEVGDEVRRAVDGEPDGGGSTVPGEVDGDAVELVPERRELDRPLCAGQPRPVEEDDRRAPFLAGVRVSRRLVNRAGSVGRQFTSFRSTA